MLIPHHRQAWDRRWKSFNTWHAVALPCQWHMKGPGTQTVLGRKYATLSHWQRLASGPTQPHSKNPGQWDPEYMSLFSDGCRPSHHNRLHKGSRIPVPAADPNAGCHFQAVLITPWGYFKGMVGVVSLCQGPGAMGGL